MQKVSLYWHSMRYLKPSQVYYRIRKILKMNCTLGVRPTSIPVLVFPITTVEELDYDPVFLERFPVEELMGDRVTFLHESEEFHWRTKWDFPNRSLLWNFNLHYFEFIFPLIKAYRDTGAQVYLDKIKECINGWIQQNTKQSNGPGWAAYTIALRLANWLSCYASLEDDLKKDRSFTERMIASMYEQYCYLANHLEKDLLGNHYFENLKTLVMCALFFRDDKIKQAAIKELIVQCREQILPDGMHFELSPMYHKIIFEDIIRVAVALRGTGQEDCEIEAYLQPMLNVSYSFEEGLVRIPLFNDGGNNIAKSLNALLSAAKNHFNLEPQFKAQLPDSGYYIFRNGDWKLIVDAGQPGPDYIPGHAHCDAMSYELYRAGTPVLVNCGTYAYQCKERNFFRSTAAHNTVMIDGNEQSQCWGVFRMAKRAHLIKCTVHSQGITIQLRDYQKRNVNRTLMLTEHQFWVEDSSDFPLTSYIHYEERPLPSFTVETMQISAETVDDFCVPYAEEYGKMKQAICLRATSGKGRIRWCISLG